MHPRLAEHLAHIAEHTYAGLEPPVDTDAQLATDAAALGMTTDDLRWWRTNWNNTDEWRTHAAEMLVADIISAVEQPGPRHWSRSRTWRRIVHHLSLAGIIAGSCYSTDWAGSRTHMIRLTGTRYSTGRRAWPSHVLYWPRRKWGCVLRRRHWPTDDVVAFEYCSRCIPCHECGLPAPLEHRCGAR